MRFTICAFAILCFATAASGQSIAPADARRIDSVFAAVDRTNSPGCALGIYRDGQIAYARGYGMANLEHGIAISPRTVFDIGVSLQAGHRSRDRPAPAGRKAPDRR